MSRSNPPKVSIIINNYNYGTYIARAISSALNQTYQPLEVVVVDDGSFDNSREVILSFGEQVISVFKSNGGQGSAYNYGFKSSTGSAILYLDSDDMLEPSAIEEAMARFEVGVSKVHFYLRVVEGVAGALTDAVLPAARLADGDVQSTVLRSGNYVSPPSTGNLYSRAALSQILPMPEKEYLSHADLYCIFLVPLFGTVRAVPKVLGRYRVHGNNRDAQTEITGALLRYRLEKEVCRDELLAAVWPEHGVNYQLGSVQNDINYHKIRLTSFLVERDKHPFVDDTAVAVLFRAVSCCWRQRGVSLLKRFYVSLWFVGLALSPLSMRDRFLKVGFVPARRTRFVNWLLALDRTQSPHYES